MTNKGDNPSGKDLNEILNEMTFDLDPTPGIDAAFDALDDMTLNPEQYVTINANDVMSTTWAANAPDSLENASVSIDNDGVTLGPEADITVDGRSLKDFMEAMERRMCILQEDLEKHEQYPALKKAYEQYKMIEKLLENGRSENS